MSSARNATPAPPSGGNCTDPGCSPSTDDGTWRVLSLPHDFVVEGNHSQSATASQGYLPFGVAWYRKHMDFPADAQTGATMWIDFEGIQTASTVYLNGNLLGTWGYGYTNSRYFVDPSMVIWGASNLLAVKVE